MTIIDWPQVARGGDFSKSQTITKNRRFGKRNFLVLGRKNFLPPNQVFSLDSRPPPASRKFFRAFCGPRCKAFSSSFLIPRGYQKKLFEHFVAQGNRVLSFIFRAPAARVHFFERLLAQGTSGVSRHFSGEEAEKLARSGDSLILFLMGVRMRISAPGCFAP